MSRKPDEREELTEEELAEQDGEPLPERTAMTVIDPGHGFQPLPLPLPVEPGETLPIEPPATE